MQIGYPSSSFGYAQDKPRSSPSEPEVGKAKTRDAIIP